VKRFALGCAPFGGLEAVCTRHGVSLPAVAMAFPVVACVLVGARSPEELAEDVAGFEQPIPDELWGELLS
jgi:D-threo-aldose 1-dehydrogenase